MKLETRIEQLESSKAGQAGELYEDRANYRRHMLYVVDPDGAVMSISDLSAWPDEAALWSKHPRGTKFLRLNRTETAEIVDGVARAVRFRPFVSTPDIRRAMDELYKDVTGEWPGLAREVES
ncbi:MAG: hypothetical protein CVU60_17215 [Deltaproteobacteria bacterium HGW-Deltaproteobacteria-18]|nr:MAG: hypothetical protein CVU60_17215 [Deltaproteobacteria bacterium HGW-Deltaproteobacteria-18]